MHVNYASLAPDTCILKSASVSVSVTERKQEISKHINQDKGGKYLSLMIQME